MINLKQAARLLAGACFCLVAQCTSIAVSPTCPAELQVGESGEVAANEVNPGGVPLYLWEVFPSDAGTFANREAPDTTFQATEEGTVTIRLTAADGIYQVQASCTTIISGAAPLAVTLSAVPQQPTVGQSVTLTCRSIGEIPATTFTIEQIEGPRIVLRPLSEGVVSLTPVIAGAPRFSCVGVADDGMESAPTSLTLNVAPLDNANGNDNDNDNDNSNANDNDNNNDNTNGNDNGGGRR